MIQHSVDTVGEQSLSKGTIKCVVPKMYVYLTEWLPFGTTCETHDRKFCH